MCYLLTILYTDNAGFFYQLYWSNDLIIMVQDPCGGCIYKYFKKQ